MANDKKISLRLKVHNVKFVKKAGLWCETIIENGKQVQTWHEDRPNLR